MIENLNKENEVVSYSGSVPTAELKQLREQLEREKDDAIVK